jgi:glyoxylase-like metal-dependent hydrolase (beta-lactamase superfamily II)
MSKLNFAVKHVKRSGVTRDLPYGREELRWVANSSTLIYGERDAILIDTFTTIDQNDELVEWVRSFGRRLQAVYITHGHGDHFFGLAQLQRAFPQAELVIAPAGLPTAAFQASDAYVESFWGKLFPGQIPDPIVLPLPLRDARLDLEGREIRVIDTGFTDTENTTSVWVPEIELLVSGDVVYDDTHPYLTETDAGSRQVWLTALDMLQELEATTIVPGHGRLRIVGPEVIDDTATYLRDFDAAVGRSADAAALFDSMMRKHGNRVNPGSLWGAAKKALQS